MTTAKINLLYISIEINTIRLLSQNKQPDFKYNTTIDLPVYNFLSMTQNNLQSSGNRKELLIIATIAISFVIALAYFILTIVGNFEKHVDTVKNTKVPYEESLSWRPDPELCEKGIGDDLEKFPNRTEAIYEQLELSEKSIELIGRMKNLTRLSLRDSIIKGDWLIHITDLPLTFLSLNGTKVPDNAIPHIMKLNDLKLLDMGDTEITDNGLKILASHPKIETLELDRTELSDTGIKYLESKKNLKRLDISSTKVTTKCIDSILKLKNLVGLDLSGIQLDAASIVKLTRLKRLQFLTLKNNAVTDDALKSITALKNLRLLNLSRNKITDKGLTYVNKLPRLIGLELTSCRNISKEAVEKIKRAHPKCVIKYTNTRNDLPADFPIDIFGGDLESLESKDPATDQKSGSHKD